MSIVRGIAVMKRAWLAIVVSLALAGAMSIQAIASSDASRIVSIGGAVTEILYALGVDRNIVAVDTTSQYPPQALKEKPSVGYMRQLGAEGVLSLRPTLILAIDGAGPKETLAVINAAKVPMITVPDAYTGDAIVEKIRILAEATSTVERGRCLAGQVRADLDALRQFESGIAKPKRVLFALSFVNGRAMAAGRHTAADGIIRLAGGVNAISEYEGYKPLSDEAVIAANPDVVLAMAHAGPAPLTADAVFSHPAFAATPASASRSFIAMDGLYLLGFGPRSARAARDLALALYPDLKRDLLPSERSSAEPCRQ